MVLKKKFSYESPVTEITQLSAERNFCESQSLDTGLEAIVEDPYTWIF